MSATRVVGLASAFVLLVAACGGDDSDEVGSSPTPTEPAGQEVTILAEDYSYSDAPEELSAGVVELTFQNDGGSDTGISPQVAFSLGGTYSVPEVTFDKQPLIQFLTQRALEREQERVESMQASLMEKQRLRRQLGLFEADEEERNRLQRDEEARRRSEAKAREVARQAAEEAQQLEAQKPQAAPAGGTNAPLASPDGGQSLNEFLKSLEQVPAAPAPQP